jgi:hypothetical protein
VTQVRRLAAALLILVGAAAQAQNEADPVAFVQAIYRDYQRDKPTAWPDRAYSPRLQKVIDDDKKNTPAGDAGKIDWDPFIAGQDWKIEGLSVTLVSRNGDTAVVEARFRNLGSPVDLRYSLVRGGGRWLIDDLENLVKPRWTMSKILAGAPDAFPDDPQPK